ncbi:TerB family tellurite resistance protein [Bacteroides finegoldii]|uniref:Co-chaperone DjlA N-terminal domain-containing protein n=1 Tax=Bacteroides finegoldii TaxID=338188 RepID=A0A174CPC6_9BACE|nr:TerB family tellurite resistance protein [Bacteroides finegoldii]CUO14059.1 Uncharacterised protein [Bacteroides finegoldii]
MGQMISWDSVMDKALSMPGVKVERENYLMEAFSNYDGVEQLREGNARPIDVFDSDIVERVANGAIKGHLLKVTALSTAAGIPGGPVVVATVSGDLIQYYWHVLVLAQKLGYIYGWPDLLGENKQVNENTKNILTVFVGVMLGAQAANKLIGEIAKNISTQIAKRLSQKALTKTVYYPVIKQVAKWIGVKLTKDMFAKGVSKAVPIIGGMTSGMLTFVTFKPMANKLQKELRFEMEKYCARCSYSENSDDIQDLPTIEVENVEDDNVNLEMIKIQACINIAKIDFELADSEIVLITDMINDSSLDDDDKMKLLEQLHSKEILNIDFTKLKGSELHSIALIENLIAVVKIDNIIKPAEKIYLFKIVHDLGFSREDIQILLEA